MTNKIGRNDPCPCGSGKKYKNCCLNKDIEEALEPLGPLSVPPPQRKLNAGYYIDGKPATLEEIASLEENICPFCGKKFKWGKP